MASRKNVQPVVVIQQIVDIMSQEVTRIGQKEVVNAIDSRSLTSYMHCLLDLVKEQRQAAKDMKLDELQDLELAELVKEAGDLLKKGKQAI